MHIHYELSLKTLFSSAKNAGFRERHLFTYLQYKSNKTNPPPQDIPTQEYNISITVFPFRFVPCLVLYHMLDDSQNAFFHFSTSSLLVTLAIVNKAMKAVLGEPIKLSVSIRSMLTKSYLYVGGRMAATSAGIVDDFT